VTAFAEQLERLAYPAAPSRPAFVDHHGRVLLSHGELGAQVRRRTGSVRASGLEPGERLAFGVRQGPAGLAWLVGALRAGVGVVALEPGLAPAALVAQCRAAGVRGVLLDRIVAALATTALGRGLGTRLGVRLPDPRDLGAALFVTGRTVAPGSRRLDTLSGPVAAVALDAEATALVVFTSGTSGAPRGIVHSPRSLGATIAAVTELTGIRPGDRVAASGLHLVVPTLVAGATVVVPPRGPRALARATARLDVSHLSLAPHAAVEWAERGGAGPLLRRLFLGTAPVRNVALARILSALPAAAEVWSVYGMTEQLLVAAVSGRERLAHDEHDGDLVGSPLPGVRVRVAADGELWIGGPLLARGLIGDDAAAAPELPTGDVARLLGDGRIILAGRRKEMLIRHGQNIYPALYEGPLADLAGLEAAAIVGVPDEAGDERVVLVVVPPPGEVTAVVLRRVRALVDGDRSPLDRHAAPDAILAMSELPRSGRSAKLDRRGLAVLVAGRLGWPEPDDAALPEAG